MGRPPQARAHRLKPSKVGKDQLVDFRWHLATTDLVVTTYATAARDIEELAAMAKLKQVCNHPAQLLHDRSAVGARSGKVTRLEELLGEILSEGDRVLCFTQFTEFAEMLLPHLSTRFGQDVLCLHGGTPKMRRDEMVARFQSGTGLNLTSANHVVHLDRRWNPAVENQATDRAFRIGQQRTVQVRKFVCVGTHEERIDEMIEEPGSVTARVQGSRARPYRVRVGVTALGKAGWDTAKLLAGEMPDDIEDVFVSAGSSLFPATPRELSMDCSCPGWEVPCNAWIATSYPSPRFRREPTHVPEPTRCSTRCRR